MSSFSERNDRKPGKKQSFHKRVESRPEKGWSPAPTGRSGGDSAPRGPRGKADADREAFAAELRDEDGADVLVMGCAGMARYRDRLQRHVGLPVVEPSQAAVAMAIGRSRLGWSA